MQPADLLGQLGVRSGAGQGELADVVFDVEVRVVDPVRLVQAERDVQQLAPQDRYQGEALGQDFGQPGQGQRLGRFFRVQHGQPADVAGGAGRLEREEGGVKSGELLHIPGSPSLV